MNKIHISTIIKIENPQEYKLHAARWSGKTQPLDAFVRNKKDWFNWNRWRNTKNDFNRPYIISLIDFYHESDMWLFGGIYKVIKRREEQKSFAYDIEELNEYSNLVGRLKVELQKPSRGRAFLLENYLNNMFISEIFREVYSGQIFPGYENIAIDFSELSNIINIEKPDWKSALQSVKGIYCIYDKKNGKKYIGSAYGDYGIWNRWENYIKTGHGGNILLRSLIAEKGMKYIIDNFQFSLLEWRSFTTDNETIIKRENYWKKALLSTGNFGYNDK